MSKQTMLLLGALLVTVVAHRLLLLFDAIVFAPMRRQKLMETGGWKSVEAEEISKYAEPEKDGHYKLFYRWIVNGKTYRGRFDLHTDNQPTMTLYYVKNPANAVNDLKAISRFEYSSPLFVGLLLLNIVLACLLFG